MKNNLLLWGAVAVGAYLIYKKMQDNKNNPTDIDVAPTPVTKTQPAVGRAEGVATFKCPTKEQMARSRFTEEGIKALKAKGCI
jgi:hypothetical protein